MAMVIRRVRKSSGRPAGRPIGTSGVQMDARRHRLMVRDQAKLLRDEQRAITVHVAARRGDDPTWLMPREMIERAEMIANFLVRVPHAVARNQAMLDEAEQSVPTAQLEAQLRHELVLAASSYTEDDWRLLDEARAKRQPGRWVADAARSAA